MRKALENELSLTMENTLIEKQPTANTGIGFTNLKKRLAINYPNRHTFMFKIEQRIAHTQLTLRLPK